MWPHRIVSAVGCVGVLFAVAGCVPDTQDTPLARALLKAANDDPGLAIGKRWCDDCTVSVTDARRSGTVAAASVHISFNQEGNDTNLVLFAHRDGRWRVLSGSAAGCGRLARIDHIPVNALRSLDVCPGRN
jgi:hypothetical protein